LFYETDPFIQNGTFAIRAVLSKDSKVNSTAFPISRVQCSDSHEELPCRVDASYKQFIVDYPNCAWLFRGEDDTFVNTSVLYRFLVHLNGVYDGMEMIVFRAHANPEMMGKYYVHGGSGWLCSRAFVDVHVRLELSLVSLLKWARYHQQDTAESIIVNRMFASAEMWDDMGMQGYTCDDCGSWMIRKGRWRALRICPADRVVVRLKDLWALHTTSVRGGVMKLIKAIPFAPAEVMLARNMELQRSFPCRQGAKTIVWNYTGRPLAFLKIGDLPVPFINFTTLPDDNVVEDAET
jgi:hypothetical protein